MIRGLLVVLILLAAAAAIFAFRGGITGNATLALNNISECRNLKSDNAYFLDSDIMANDNCFNITGDNILLDGKGHTISFIKSAMGAAIFASGTNFEVRNLTISISTGNNKDGVRIINGVDGVIDSVNVFVRSDDSYAFYLYSSANMNVSNNNLSVYGSGSRAMGIFNCFDNSFFGNRIETFGEGGYGMQIYGSETNLFSMDRIETYGAIASGMNIGNSVGNVFFGERINTSGTGSYGLEFVAGDIYQEIFDSSIWAESGKGLLFSQDCYGNLSMTNSSIAEADFSGNMTGLARKWYLNILSYLEGNAVFGVDYGIVDSAGRMTEAESDEDGGIFLILPGEYISAGKREDIANYTIYVSYENISRYFAARLDSNYYREIDVGNLGLLEDGIGLIVEIISPLARDYFGNSINISVRTNQGAVCNYTLDGSAAKGLALTNGMYSAEETRLNARSYDLTVSCSNGAEVIKKTVHFSLGTGDFSVELASPRQGEFVKQSCGYAFLAQNDFGIEKCDLMLDGMKAGFLETVSIEHENMIEYCAAAGEHEAYIRCIDSKGRIGESDSITFSVAEEMDVEDTGKEILVNDTKKGGEDSNKNNFAASFAVFLITIVFIVLLLIVWMMFGNKKGEAGINSGINSLYKKDDLENFR